MEFRASNFLRLATCLLAFLSAHATLAIAQNYDCSSVPFEATYNPDVAYAYEQQCGNTLPTLNVPTFNKTTAPVNFVGIHEATQTVFVNGMQFHVEDYQSAVDSQKALDWPITPLPAGYRPIGPDEYKGYVKRSKYRIQHPIKAKIRSVMNSIKKHYRDKQQEYERMRKKIERHVAQCYAIAESMYPGDDDALSDYANDCVDGLPWASR